MTRDWKPYTENGLMIFVDYPQTPFKDLYNLFEVLQGSTFKKWIIDTANDPKQLLKFKQLTGIEIAGVLRQTSVHDILREPEYQSFFSVRQFIAYCYYLAMSEVTRWEFIGEVNELVNALHFENINKHGYVLVQADKDFMIHPDTPRFIEGDADLNGEYVDITNAAVLEKEKAAAPNHIVKVFHTIFRFKYDNALFPFRITKVVEL